MKSRHVYATADLEAARAALDAARAAGVADSDLLLVGRSDIELDSIPDSRKEADTDFVPAAARGIGLGGAVGALAGLIAVVTPVGVTLAGAAAITAAGALVGGWASALAGAALPDPIRQKFEAEIESGSILLIVDSEGAAAPRGHAAILGTGARVLPFESTTALS